MFQKFMIAVLVIILLAAAGFSIANISSQNTIDDDLQEEAIAAVLKEAEQSLLEETLAESENIEPGPGMGMGHQETDPQPAADETAHDVNTISGTVEILSSGVLNITTADDSVIPVWIGNGALTLVTDFALDNGSTVSVEGFWSGSGNFMAQTLTNQDTGAVLDLSTLDIPDSITTAASGGGQGGYGQSGGQGGGQSVRGGNGGGGGGYRGGRQ